MSFLRFYIQTTEMIKTHILIHMYLSSLHFFTLLIRTYFRDHVLLAILHSNYGNDKDSHINTNIFQCFFANFYFFMFIEIQSLISSHRRSTFDTTKVVSLIFDDDVNTNEAHRRSTFDTTKVVPDLISEPWKM